LKDLGLQVEGFWVSRDEGFRVSGLKDLGFQG
jgi:hypothetical protein